MDLHHLTLTTWKTLQSVSYCLHALLCQVAPYRTKTTNWCFTEHFCLNYMDQRDGESPKTFNAKKKKLISVRTSKSQWKWNFDKSPRLGDLVLYPCTYWHEIFAKIRLYFFTIFEFLFYKPERLKDTEIIRFG